MYYFYIKSTFFRFFLDKIYTPKRTILKKFLGEHAPKHAHFSKNSLNPPPPPNEILDTQLQILQYMYDTQ